MVHEITNVLSLVKKSNEGSLELCDGLFEMVEAHVSKMSRDDMALLKKYVNG